MKLRYATVCSGIDAPAVAWNPLGWQQIFSSEIEAFPCAVLHHHHPQVPNYGDMTQYAKWPSHQLDVLIGGTPCQSFSVAGLRKGLADPRGNLALTFLAIVERYAPTWVVWENVPGVFSSWSDGAVREETEERREAGRTAFELARSLGFDAAAANEFGNLEEVDQSNDLDCFTAGLGQLGYGWALASLDAQFRGVAQRRERVFVVGHIGGQWQRAAAVLFDRESVCGNPPPRRESREGIAGGVAPSIGASGRGFSRAGETLGQDPVIPIQEIGKRQSGTAMNGVGHGQPGDPMYTLQKSAEHGVAIGFDSKQGGDTQLGATEEKSPPLKGQARHAVAHTLRAEHDASEDGTGRGTPIVAVDGSDAKSGGMRNREGCPGGGKGPLFSEEKSLTLAANANDQVLFHSTVMAHGQGNAEMVKDGEPSLTCNHEAPIGFIPEICGTLSDGAHNGGGLNGHPAHSGRILPVAGTMAVRRLTPRECERLQGFPDDYTLIPYRGKPAADGPRYKGLGNSMAVPVIHWIGQRIEQVEHL